MRKRFAVTHVAKIILRVSISVSLMIYLLSKVDVSSIVYRCKEADWLMLIAIPTVIYLFSVMLKSIRLRILLNEFNITLPIWWLSLIQLKSNFLKIFLPGGATTSEVYKTYAITTQIQHKSEAISTVVVEKVVGVFTILILSLISLCYAGYSTAHPLFKQLTTLILVLLAIFLLMTVVFSRTVHTRLIDPLKDSSKFWTFLKNLHGQFSTLFSKKWTIFQVVVMTMLIQVVVVVWHFAISTAIDLALPFLILLATIPIAELMLMLPLSISGLGIREAAFVFLLTPFGLTMEDAISLSMLCFIIGSVLRILSGTAFLLQGDLNMEPISTKVRES